MDITGQLTTTDMTTARSTVSSDVALVYLTDEGEVLTDDDGAPLLIRRADIARTTSEA